MACSLTNWGTGTVQHLGRILFAFCPPIALQEKRKNRVSVSVIDSSKEIRIGKNAVLSPLTTYTFKLKTNKLKEAESGKLTAKGATR